MEIVPSAYYQSLKRYWRRRRYKRLNGANSNKRKLKIARLGAGTARRLWRMRATPKISRNIILSPIKLLAKFHDAYVDVMIRLATGNGGRSNDVGLFGEKRVAKGPQISTVSSGEEVDGRLVLEIYKRIVSTREIAVF
ncbi:hypothetical protein CJ030_MR7G017786 [Morella rubra]|uniref:Uncharacterized protein n=1 Tax=Morella rubra TaxID=262757 RepID=A0A6A1UYU4_9ROSI|nr:hypothetical protein CJ030_MR7G017786 [Morella rubra]